MQIVFYLISFLETTDLEPTAKFDSYKVEMFSINSFCYVLIFEPLNIMLFEPFETIKFFPLGE